MTFKKLGKFLRELREKKNYTVQQLRDLLGVTRNSIYQWERGALVPGTKNLEKICFIYTLEIKTIRKIINTEQAKNLIADLKNMKTINGLQSNIIKILQLKTLSKKKLLQIVEIIK